MTEPKAVLLRFDARDGYTLGATEWPWETLYGPFWTISRLSKWATENGYFIVSREEAAFIITREEREEAAQPEG